jgi:hypothetical protein
MTTPDQAPEPKPEPEPELGFSIVDWRPDTAAAVRWNIVGIALTVAGLVLFALPMLLRSGPTGVSVDFGLMDILVITLVTTALMGVHEGIHGLVMRMFGARPTFGAMLVGHVVPAFYATAAGHRFTRRQYLLIAAAPAVSISLVGFIACFSPWGGYLIVPLAIHFGGCVGDGFAVLRTLREPATTRCEDLRDGVRFYRKTGA